ncbi:MAG: hypothetical protein ACTSRZ_05755 [Promethearchaeota archaeon]
MSNIFQNIFKYFVNKDNYILVEKTTNKDDEDENDDDDIHGNEDDDKEDIYDLDLQEITDGLKAYLENPGNQDNEIITNFIIYLEKYNNINHFLSNLRIILKDLKSEKKKNYSLYINTLKKMKFNEYLIFDVFYLYAFSLSIFYKCFIAFFLIKALIKIKYKRYTESICLLNNLFYKLIYSFFIDELLFIDNREIFYGKLIELDELFKINLFKYNKISDTTKKDEKIKNLKEILNTEEDKGLIKQLNDGFKNYRNNLINIHGLEPQRITLEQLNIIPGNFKIIFKKNIENFSNKLNQEFNKNNRFNLELEKLIYNHDILFGDNIKNKCYNCNLKENRNNGTKEVFKFKDYIYRIINHTYNNLRIINEENEDQNDSKNYEYLENFIKFINNLRNFFEQYFLSNEQIIIINELEDFELITKEIQTFFEKHYNSFKIG